MSSHNKKVMSLEDKVRIIRKFETLSNTNTSDINSFIKSNESILTNKSKILAQYDGMRAKLAAVRDLVTAENNKPNYIPQKHAFLQKIMLEWYRRAFRKHGTVSVALLGHSTDIARRILNISGLPLFDSHISVLKRNCHQASLQTSSKFDESSTLCIRKIAQEMLKEMGMSKVTALIMYGPRMFEEGSDESEDGMAFLGFPYVGKRKLNPKERPSNKSPRTTIEKHASFGCDIEGELNRSDVVQSESGEADTDAAHSNDCIWPYEVATEEDNENEEEDFDLYDVVSVVDSTEEFDAATSGVNNIPECTTDCAKGAVVACTVIKTEPDEGQSTSTDDIVITDVRERVEEWLLKKECDITEDGGNSQEACATFGPICSNKIESEDITDQKVNCEAMSTTTSLQDCVKQETGEANIDRDDDRSVHLDTVASTSTDNFDADSATSSTKNPRWVYSDLDAVRSVERIKGFLQKQKNHRALEALAKVEAAFPRSSEKLSLCMNVKSRPQ